MEELLEEMALFLTDILQSGLATAGPDGAKRAADLAQRAELAGMHTGAALLEGISRDLEARQHQMEKTDRPLAEGLCRMSYYIELCRQRRTEENIRQRWQEGEHP